MIDEKSIKMTEFNLRTGNKNLYRFDERSGGAVLECRSCGDLHPGVYYESESKEQAKKDFKNGLGTCEICLIEFLGEWDQEKQRRKEELEKIVG